MFFVLFSHNLLPEILSRAAQSEFSLPLPASPTFPVPVILALHDSQSLR